MDEFLDDVAQFIVRLLPQRVRYWSLIRSGVKGMEPDEVVPEVPFVTVLSRTPRR